ncbi:hypothetical protein PS467_20800 [Streptomyces luomodiensis]|uniref:Uncharacterized protein n=1 Tax=Streptomyces luomodiensis TaxID=3026192 RepID=A0ABY9UYE9_9ACTN|nr:hypothetical protein [Streptomyces sp. SCA4-21]WNE97595.1 hypothetical protein PS467_20800 [Streptomyces sp. SCA4-21]
MLREHIETTDGRGRPPIPGSPGRSRIAVLFRFYAKVIDRNQQRSNEQIEQALKDDDDEQS